MDFTRNEAQEELGALSRRILDGVTQERLHAAAGGFDAALWADLAGAGILAAALPESAGGAGLGLLEQCSVLAEIGRAVAPAPYLASIVLGANAYDREGSAGALLSGRVERMHRAALILTFGGGTNEVQRDIIGAAALGLPLNRR